MIGTFQLFLFGLLLRAIAGFQGDPLLRIYGDGVHVHHPMKVRAIGAAGGSHVADYVTFAHASAGFYV